MNQGERDAWAIGDRDVLRTADVKIHLRIAVHRLQLSREAGIGYAQLVPVVIEIVL